MSLSVPLSSAKAYDPIKEGAHLARCVNIIELGTTSYTWQGKEVSSNKVRIVFELPEEKIIKEDKTETCALLSVEFSISMGPKANLRHFVENWIGASLFQNEANGFELTDLLDMTAIITVKHTKKGDKTYVDIVSAAPLLKSMKCPEALHELKKLSYDNWNQAFFDTLPEFIRKKMEATPEYEQMLNRGKFVEGQIPFK